MTIPLSLEHFIKLPGPPLHWQQHRFLRSHSYHDYQHAAAAEPVALPEPPPPSPAPVPPAPAAPTAPEAARPRFNGFFFKWRRNCNYSANEEFELKVSK